MFRIISLLLFTSFLGTLFVHHTDVGKLREELMVAEFERAELRGDLIYYDKVCADVLSDIRERNKR